MDESTSFEWEKVFVFEAYLSREYMENVVGLKWTNANSYLGYLLQDDFPLLDESLHKLVFVNNDKVILDITLDRYNIDFLPIKELIKTERIILIAEKNNNKYIIKRSERTP
ncbi:hypothetical protein [Paenibacillus sp. CMAA1364]